MSTTTIRLSQLSVINALISYFQTDPSKLALACAAVGAGNRLGVTYSEAIALFDGWVGRGAIGVGRDLADAIWPVALTHQFRAESR